MSNPIRLRQPLAPGATIGILGGGQLGRMLALAAARLGFKVCIYSDVPDAPAFDVAASHIHAGYDDKPALERLVRHCDVVTYEFENIPAETTAFIAVRLPLAPSVQALETTQDRIAEKTLVSSLGLKVPAFFAVSTPAEAADAFVKVGGTPCVLKTRRFGYDGKGQATVASAFEAAAAQGRLNAPCILEAFVDFAFEASVIGARAYDGRFAAYDPPENVHEHHILRRSTVPGRLSPAQGAQAKAVAEKIAAALDYVGVLAVELFVAKDGSFLVNEIAPRVHNSGHWTLEACPCSQFEQHIRAIAGWPLGSTARTADVVMENILGFEAADYLALAAKGALHLYGKAEMRDGRKMGHLTMVKQD
jgi:5-(carboxyamino)imidazole ribonucleotide synthase